MISLSTLDITIIFSLFTIILLVGIYVGKSSGKNTNQYFLSGRNMPWWLLGISMVATTFSTDTPNLVTDIVRTNGVSGNWVWWAFLVTGLLTVFVYAKLWRKSEVKTDIEFYELRYGGKPARFLRSFRAIYLGIIFNVLAMAGVTLAAIKIGQVMLGLPPITTVVIAGCITVLFSAIGGFKGVVYTDFILFFVAMAG
ncbi:MAG: Na+:solute symporter, partial [Flavobacterium sp.]|nr:Na+:solute symporter [Flavobacterium sp.]